MALGIALQALQVREAVFENFEHLCTSCTEVDVMLIEFCDDP